MGRVKKVRGMNMNANLFCDRGNNRSEVGAKLFWLRTINRSTMLCEYGAVGMICLHLDIPYTNKVRTSRIFPSLAVSGSLDPIPGILGNGAAKDQSDSRP